MQNKLADNGARHFHRILVEAWECHCEGGGHTWAFPFFRNHKESLTRLMNTAENLWASCAKQRRKLEENMQTKHMRNRRRWIRNRVKAAERLAKCKQCTMMQRTKSKGKWWKKRFRKRKVFKKQKRWGGKVKNDWSERTERKKEQGKIQKKMQTVVWVKIPSARIDST